MDRIDMGDLHDQRAELDEDHILIIMQDLGAIELERNLTNLGRRKKVDFVD